MFGDEGQESTSEVQEHEAAPATETENHSTEEQANPFWGEVEKLTGPNVYKLIQPHLAKADTAARQRVEQVNQSYAPWKAFADKGITPEQVEQSFGVVRQLNDPQGQLQVYESLRNFLQENGRLPDEQELQQQVAEDEGEGDPQDDPRFAALEQQNLAIAQFLQDQQMQAQRQAANQEADSWVESEISRLKDPKFGFDQSDIQEILRIASFQTQQTGQMPESLDQAAQQYAALRDRIRTTPRPGQVAPRIPSGPGGGSPQQAAIDPSKLSRDDRRALVAQMLQSGKQS